jgi:serine/threonine protein kinase
VHLNSAAARTASAAPGEPDLENFKGKISYMAPETIRGQPQDGRVDIFALGTVLWESLTGRRLFYGKDNLER